MSQTERESMRRGRERDGLPVEQCTSASTCSWMEGEEEEEEERCRGYTCHMNRQNQKTSTLFLQDFVRSSAGMLVPGLQYSH